VSAFRKAYTVVGALLILEYLAQFYLIATAIFTLGQAFDPDTHKAASSGAIYAAFKNADAIASIHVVNGYDVIPITTVVLIGLSLAARHPRKTTLLTGLLFVLLVFQIALVWLRFPAVTALHALNAIVLLGLAGWLTWTNWAWRAPSEPVKTIESANRAHI
jgi:hypothetical protein